jgi:hypothetical protein
VISRNLIAAKRPQPHVPGIEVARAAAIIFSTAHHVPNITLCKGISFHLFRMRTAGGTQVETVPPTGPEPTE